MPIIRRQSHRKREFLQVIILVVSFIEIRFFGYSYNYNELWLVTRMLKIRKC